jgi:hypothetical protein
MIQDDTLAFMESIQDTYRYHFRDFADWLDGREFSLGGVRDYFIYLNQDSGYAPGTIRIKRQAVKKRVKQYAYEMLDFEGRAKVNDLLYELDHTGETSAPKLQSEEIQADRYLIPRPRLQNCCKRPVAAARGRLSASYGIPAAVYRK